MGATALKLLVLRRLVWAEVSHHDRLAERLPALAPDRQAIRVLSGPRPARYGGDCPRQGGRPGLWVFAAAATQMAIPHRVALREIRGGLTVAARASEVGEFTPLSGVVALLASREKQECTVKPLLSMQSG